MNKVTQVLSMTISASLCLSTFALAGCNHVGTQATAPTAVSTAPASTVPAAAPGDPSGTPAPLAAALPQAASAPDAYALPSANQLYEMVAPIALFPDKLLAQVLAGASFPEQIAAADQWLAQNSTLKGRALQAAVDPQPWDPSIKSLTSFRSVLDQMAQNMQWTAALGTAYVNDPTDVMNAVQVMRQRARAKGALENNAQQRVSTMVDTAAPADMVAAGQPGSVIVPPPQTIVIEPAQAGVVYVPVYNPTVVYGMPMPLYPGYVYAPPAYSEADMVATGLISFGLGVAVGAALDNHYNWGWNAWGVHWGGGYVGGWGAHGGAVVFHNTPYWSHSTTIINHVNNIHVGPNYRPDFGHDVNRHIINTYPGGHLPYRDEAHNAAGFHPDARPMSEPHFDQFNRTDSNRSAVAEPRAELPQNARAHAGQMPHPFNGSATAPGAAHPDFTPRNGIAPRTLPNASTLPQNHGRGELGAAHPPILASAHNAPLTNRDSEGLAAGLGRWHHR